jgi:outer membrane protein TolC
VKRALFVLLVLAAGRLTATAQEITLTLDEAVARAVKESPRAAEFRAREEGARAAVESRAAEARPQLSFQGGYLRTNHVDVFGVPQPDGRLRVVYPDIPDNFRTRLDAAWPIYTGGRTESLVAAARAEAEGVRQDLAAVEADLAFETTRAYWHAVTAAETVQVVEQALARLDAHIRDLRVRLDAGLIPPNEVLTAEAQRSRQHVLVIEARNGAELGLAELRRLVDLPGSTRVRLATPLAAPELPAAALEEQIARAKAARPERAALVSRIEAAAARIKAAGWSSRPAVALAGGIDYGRPNPRIFPRTDAWQDSWDVSVNASWSLWDGGRRAAAVGEASAAERSLRARLEEFDSLVALDVQQRRLDLEAGLSAAGAAAEGVRSAAEARRVVDERFAAGVATSTDMLDAQVTLLQAELDRMRALADARIAEARLRRAVGQ